MRGLPLELAVDRTCAIHSTPHADCKPISISAITATFWMYVCIHMHVNNHSSKHTICRAVAFIQNSPCSPNSLGPRIIFTLVAARRALHMRANCERILIMCEPSRRHQWKANAFNQRTNRGYVHTQHHHVPENRCIHSDCRVSWRGAAGSLATAKPHHTHKHLR